MTKALSYVELDVPYCPLNYGVAPCAAVLGVTGSVKCFNCITSCQSRSTFGRAANAEDFSELSIGSGVPTGFTSRFNTTNVTYTTALDSGVVGGNQITCSRATNNKSLLSWDAPGSIADLEFLARMKISGGTTNSANRTLGGICVRGSGAGGSENGYTLSYLDTNTIAVLKYVAGVQTILGTFTMSPAMSTNWLSLRLNILGTNILAKVWPVGSTEPAAWQISVGDGSVVGAGFFGMLSEAGIRNPIFDFLSYSTTGTAPSPGDASITPIATYRFAMDAAYLPKDIDCLPLLTGVQFDPAEVSLGEDMGKRASVTVTLKDAPHSDTGSGGDKYISTRTYDPFKQGTFFGKFRARQPYLFGKSLRLIRGELGQALGDMETRHFICDSFDGPHPDGTYTITAKDVLRFASGDEAQVPVPSQGYLSANITNVATAATLAPAGIGDAAYAASGDVCIGGNEICGFTRVADALTLTRGTWGTTAIAHSSEDAVQQCASYSGVSPADILYDFLVTYAKIDAGFIDKTGWENEVTTYLNQVYTGTIPKPMKVSDAVSEIIQQAALALWWDDVTEQLKLQVLRLIPTTARSFDETNIIMGTLQTTEQQDLRITESWVNYGVYDPTAELNLRNNFRSVIAEVDATVEGDFGAATIDTIYSRWIAQFGRVIAQAVALKRLDRYKNPPRKFNFDIFRDGVNDAALSLGGGYQLSFWNLQELDGSRSVIPIQVTKLTPLPDRIQIEAQEVTSSLSSGSAGSGDHDIIIDVNSTNLNLKTIHDALYVPAVAGTNVVVTINTGVQIGSTSTATPALDVGTGWAAGVNITITNNGLVQGAGGRGGSGAAKNPPPNGTDGSHGGPAFYTRFALTLDNTSGRIYGGGGGGGGGGGSSSGAGGGGGGGSGYTTVGSGGSGGGGGGGSGHSGSQFAGGSGGSSGGGTGGAGGDGGDPGHGGSTGGGGSGTRGSGGSAGDAVDGTSFVTYSAVGDIQGPQVN